MRRSISDLVVIPAGGDLLEVELTGFGPGAPASVALQTEPGPVAAGYDNPLTESTIGLFKTEKIYREGQWRALAEAEPATLEWIDWYNHERLHSACGGMSSPEMERGHQQELLHQVPMP